MSFRDGVVSVVLKGEHYTLDKKGKLYKGVRYSI